MYFAKRIVLYGIIKFLIMISYSIIRLSNKNSLKIGYSGPSVHDLFKSLEFIIKEMNIDKLDIDIHYFTREIEKELPISIDSINSFGINCLEYLKNIYVDVLLIDALFDQNTLVCTDMLPNNISPIIIHGLYKVLHTNPRLIRDFIKRGYVKSILPIGLGSILFSKRVFSEESSRYSIRVYRDPFIHGPNPIHYNTAYLLYSIAYEVLSRTNKERVIVEIGTGRAFLTLWLGIIAKHVNGILYTYEIKRDRIEYVKRAIKELELSDNIEIIYGDILNEAKSLTCDVSILFIDALKTQYHLYLDIFDDKLQSGSVILSHNTISNPHDTYKYLEKVCSGKYISLTIASDPAGITLTVKK